LTAVSNLLFSNRMRFIVTGELAHAAEKMSQQQATEARLVAQLEAHKSQADSLREDARRLSERLEQLVTHSGELKVRESTIMLLVYA